MADRLFPEIAEAVVAEALTWIGTPYRHQGCRKGIGCDCLGLVRGVWRQIYGRELEEPGAYAADWSQTGEGDRLADAAAILAEMCIAPPVDIATAWPLARP